MGEEEEEEEEIFIDPVVPVPLNPSKYYNF